MQAVQIAHDALLFQPPLFARQPGLQLFRVVEDDLLDFQGGRPMAAGAACENFSIRPAVGEHLVAGVVHRPHPDAEP